MLASISMDKFFLTEYFKSTVLLQSATQILDIFWGAVQPSPAL